MKPEFTIDLTRTYVFLNDGGSAPTIEPDDTFWRDLMLGQATSPGAALVANGDGWLSAIFRIESDMTTWEMHPAGDELLVLLSGALDIVLEEERGLRTIELRAGGACIVPRGVWHRQVVRTPGEELAITYGKGTRHRPL